MKAASVTAGTTMVVAVAVAMVAAAATTSPGRANWSPWKPSRSQSGVHSYVHLPLSWRVCNPRFSPHRASRSYKPSPSLALVSRRALSTLFPILFSLCLSVQLALSSAIPLTVFLVFRPFYLFSIYFRCLACAWSCSALSFIPLCSSDFLSPKFKNKMSRSLFKHCCW